MTPPELVDKPLRSLAVSRETPPTFYGTTHNGIYQFHERQIPEFLPLGETAVSPQVTKGELFYLHENCVKKLSLAERSATLIAGNCGPSGYGFREGMPLQALFNEPTYLALDATGRLFVADSRNLRVRLIHNNDVSTYAGKWIGTDNPTEGLNYGCPAGVCTAGSLTDRINKRGYHVPGEPAGTPTRPAATINFYAEPDTPSQRIPLVQDGDRSTATFWRPQKQAFDNQGNLYVLDHIAFQDHIRRISPEGQVTTLVSNSNNPHPVGYDQEFYPQASFTLDALSKGDNDTIQSFTVSKDLLYVLGKHLYILELSSKTWKILLHEQKLNEFKKFGDPQITEPGINALEADTEGNLYVMLSKAEGLNGVRKKILKIILPR